MTEFEPKLVELMIDKFMDGDLFSLGILKDYIEEHSADFNEMRRRETMSSSKLTYAYPVIRFLDQSVSYPEFPISAVFWLFVNGYHYKLKYNVQRSFPVLFLKVQGQAFSVYESDFWNDYPGFEVVQKMPVGQIRTFSGKSGSFAVAYFDGTRINLYNLNGECIKHYPGISMHEFAFEGDVINDIEYLQHPSGQYIYPFEISVKNGQWSW